MRITEPRASDLVGRDVASLAHKEGIEGKTTQVAPEHGVR